MSPRVALVTGGGSGIGRATALAFARAGYRVAVADLDPSSAQATSDEIRGSKAEAVAIQCDVSDEKSVGEMIGRTLAEFGRIDAAFNNAGIEGSSAECAESSVNNFDRVIRVNLRGVWLCMREEIRQMLLQDSGGAIVNCSSVAGLIGLPGIAAYSASKHGVIGLTRTAALEYAKRNIRVNAVCPGAVETPMLRRFEENAAGGREAMIAIEPIGRVGRPEEIADAVVWLCIGASFVTGHALAVDGGWTVA